MSDVEQLLDGHPEFERKLRQFMMLYDAAQVLAELKPPHGDTAAEYLREIGSHLMKEAGLPEDFVRAMVAARPPVA